MTTTPTPQDGALEEEDTFIVELYPGRPFLCKREYFSVALMGGELPNELLNFYLFEPFDVPDDLSLQEQANRQRDTWTNYGRIAARSMITPRLVLRGPVFPTTKDRIHIKRMRADELRVIAYKAIKEAVPLITAAPFPGNGDDESGGAGEPVSSGNDVPHPAEQAAGVGVE